MKISQLGNEFVFMTWINQTLKENLVFNRFTQLKNYLEVLSEQLWLAYLHIFITSKDTLSIYIDVSVKLCYCSWKGILNGTWLYKNVIGVLPTRDQFFWTVTAVSIYAVPMKTSMLVWTCHITHSSAMRYQSIWHFLYLATAFISYILQAN